MEIPTERDALGASALKTLDIAVKIIDASTVMNVTVEGDPIPVAKTVLCNDEG